MDEAAANRLADAIKPFEAQPGFSTAQVWMRDHMNRLAQQAPVESSAFGSKACSRLVLSLYNIRAAAFFRLITNIETQNNFLALLDELPHLAWLEFTGIGTPSEIRDGAPSINEGLARRKCWWTRRGYARFAALAAHQPSSPVRAERDSGRSEVEHENAGLTAVVANVDVESDLELAVDRVAHSELPVSITCGQRRFRKTGETWALCFDGLTVTITHKLGMAYIAELLRSPGRSLTCLELRVSVGQNPDDCVQEKELEGHSLIGGFHGEEILDETAVKQYRERLESIEDELREAEQNRDNGRREKLAAEKESFIDQLKSATGLRGRLRRFATDAEKARKAVSLAINRALGRIKEHDPALATHLCGSK